MTHPTLPQGYRIHAENTLINKTVFHIIDEKRQEAGYYYFVLGKGWVTNTRNVFEFPQDARDFIVGRHERMKINAAKLAQSMFENPVMAR